MLLRSTQQPVELTIADKNITIAKDKGVAKIMVQLKDQNGLPVMLSDNEVTCTISGPGVLLGLEAGNNSDMTDYTDNVQRVFHGHIAAYIQSTGESSEPIKVSFTSQWLKPVEVTITCKIECCTGLNFRRI